MKKRSFLFLLLMLSFAGLQAQDKNVSIPLIGEKAPSFTAQSTEGEITFPEDFGDNWKILFSHPKDFTPVCSSELLELSHQQQDYKDLGVSLVVLSTDIISQHQDWKRALEEISFKGEAPEKINFPLVDDSNYQISNLYGMIHPSVNIAYNIRAVFIIDPENHIRTISFYPMEMGRNMEEIKRTVVALQTIDENRRDHTPANWNSGDEMIVPYLNVAEKEKLGTPDSDIRQIAWFLNYRKK